MPYSDMLQVRQPCSTCTSCRAPRRANRNQSRTRFPAIFTDDWKWSFISKNHRSRRRTFAKSGETISGFAAVFCEDWKDGEDDDAAPAPVYEYVPPQNCRPLIWDNGCNRKRGADDFVDPLTSTWPPCKRQCEEHYNSWMAATTSSAISPTPQQIQFGEPASSSPATPECLTPPFIMPVDYEETSAERRARPEHPTQSLLSSVHPMFIDIAAETERYPHLIPVADESGDPFSTITDLFTKGEGGMMPLREHIPDQHWFPEDERGTRDGGFDHWDWFMEWSIRADGGRELEDCQDLGTPPEMSVEHDFEEFIEY